MQFQFLIKTAYARYYCMDTKSYPTKLEDTNLNRILLFKKIFKNNCRYGFQDHISGDDEMSFIIPFVSMGLGLDYIEKHVTLDRSKKGVDYYSSLETKELGNFINKIKNKIKFCNNIFSFSKHEKKYRKDVKKILVFQSEYKKKYKNQKQSFKNEKTTYKKYHTFFY